MIRWIVTILVIALLVSCAYGGSTRQTTGTIQGVVFTLDSKGERTVIPAADISLDGPAHMKTQSEGQGRFAFNAVPPGSYKISASAPGMTAAREIVVIADAISEVTLGMKLETAKQSVTVVSGKSKVSTSPSFDTLDSERSRVNSC